MRVAVASHAISLPIRAMVLINTKNLVIFLRKSFDYAKLDLNSVIW